MSKHEEARSIWNSRLGESWSLVGVGYKALGFGFNWWSYRVRRKVFERVLDRSGLKPGTALDIGAGTGFYTDILIRRGWKVVGVDLAAPAVEQLRSHFPEASFYEGTVMDVPEEKFDLIICMDVLFHILDEAEYQTTFGAIERRLSGHGLFVFTENMPERRIEHRHHISRTGEQTRQAVAAAGLRIRQAHPLFCLMNQPVKKGGTTLWWRFVLAVLTRVPSFGWVLGALLYPLELTLVRSGRGKSTDIVVASH